MDLERFIQQALQEDIGDGDHTSLSCISADQKEKAILIAKEEGLIAGIEIGKKIFTTVDPDLVITTLKNDGEKVIPSEVVLKVEGSALSILKAERLVLNCMQRMSGIATLTNKIVQKLDGLPTKVLDTRKTTPGLRYLEKISVKIGGGCNHRHGLYDMILLKDNHIDYAGGVKSAINKANNYLNNTGKNLNIIIETRNLEEVKEVIATGNVDRILLDNFNYNELKEAVLLIGDQFDTEASGGITIDTIRKYAECGVDYISMGALTHSVKSLDLSLKSQPK